jgi:mono/diheme cytochrome c family protein
MSAAIFVIAFVLLGISVVLFAMRAGGRPLFDPDKRSGRRAVAILTGIALVFFGAALPIATAIDNADSAEAGPIELTKAQESGREKFAQACQQCHTLAAVNATGKVGPNLDTLRPPKALTLDAIVKGRAQGRGQMPSQLFTGKDAEDVADFVAAVAGRAD